MLLAMTLASIWLALVIRASVRAHRRANKHIAVAGDVVVGEILRHGLLQDLASKSDETYVGDQSVIEYSYTVKGERYRGKETGSVAYYSFRYPKPFLLGRYYPVEVLYDPSSPMNSRLYDPALLRSELTHQIIVETVFNAVVWAVVVGIAYAILTDLFPESGKSISISTAAAKLVSYWPVLALSAIAGVLVGLGLWRRRSAEP
jgi:hypothetical protein